MRRCLRAPTPKVIPIHNAWIISDTASLTHTLVRHPQSDFTTCSEPPPNASSNQSETGNVNFSIISVGGGHCDAGGESESTAEVELAGRTSAALLSRELFYRACAFSQNYKLGAAGSLGGVVSGGRKGKTPVLIVDVATHGHRHGYREPIDSLENEFKKLAEEVA